MDTQNTQRRGRRIEAVEMDAHKQQSISVAVTRDQRDSIDFLAQLMKTDRSKIVRELVRLGLKKHKHSIIDLVLPVGKRQADFLAAIQDIPVVAFGDPVFQVPGAAIKAVNAIDVAWYVIGDQSLILIGTMNLVSEASDGSGGERIARVTYTATVDANWVLTVKVGHLTSTQPPATTAVVDHLIDHADLMVVDEADRFDIALLGRHE